MSMQRNPGDLLTIAAAGGGLKLAAGTYSADVLCQIVAAASESGARITITNSFTLKVDDLVRIAAAGPGHVAFE